MTAALAEPTRGAPTPAASTAEAVRAVLGAVAEGRAIGPALLAAACRERSALTLGDGLRLRERLCIVLGDPLTEFLGLAAEWSADGYDDPFFGGDAARLAERAARRVMLAGVSAADARDLADAYEAAASGEVGSDEDAARWALATPLATWWRALATLILTGPSRPYLGDVLAAAVELWVGTAPPICVDAATIDALALRIIRDERIETVLAPALASGHVGCG